MEQEAECLKRPDEENADQPDEKSEESEEDEASEDAKEERGMPRRNWVYPSNLPKLEMDFVGDYLSYMGARDSGKVAEMEDRLLDELKVELDAYGK